ncbi:Mu transposase C-terminal domain-containing protein [Leptothoe spongobia]|uniref:DDE-type integrase/transposase/recombinase n=1 Tax=Leptothoe spongobia TAU-MAC 1115 TaxID=1967444 RepID=A0A947DFS7_9CYAN|nr:Mu transposase C-terminal domain-containing protein [Leptothoe spongobia]MBT9315111.1 DDE-type integrase/transposase/recombinase [Leptothoe spongobia TAU-MAC 1115]
MQELLEASLIDTQPSNSAAASLQQRKCIAAQMKDAEAKREFLLKIDAIRDISQACRNTRRSRIKSWAKKLGKSPRTLDRWYQAFRQEGWSAIVPSVRSDKGKIRGSKAWKPSTEYWVKFIEKTYKDGNRHSRRMNRNQVYNQVKGHATLQLGLSDKEYPSHVFVYEVLEPLANKPKIRHPGQGPGIMIQTTEEVLKVEYSNQVWQIDHTCLDTLLTDEQYEIAGSPFLTTIIDTYSGCALGFYLGFESAGSHEVGIALRHAILKKKHGPEYKLTKDWEPYGLPDYIVTDRAKEFKSTHLTQVAADLDVKLRYRAYPEQGGMIESLFDKNNKEVLSLLPGYTGSNVQKRPENAEKYACVTYEELEQVLTRYLVDHYNHHHHPRARDQTRNQRWWAGLRGGKPRTIDERRLDICLTKTVSRKVQKRGSVLFERLVYQGDWLEEYKGQHVILRYDPRNIATLLVYSAETDHEPSRFLGTVKARDYEGDYLDIKDWKETKKGIRTKGKAIDQASILSERIDLNKFAQEKIKTLKQRRQAEQKRIDQKSKPTNVIELHPTATVTSDEPAPETIEDAANYDKPILKVVPEQKPEKVSEIIAFDWNELMNDV